MTVWILALFVVGVLGGVVLGMLIYRLGRADRERAEKGQPVKPLFELPEKKREVPKGGNDDVFAAIDAYGEQLKN